MSRSAARPCTMPTRWRGKTCASGIRVKVERAGDVIPAIAERVPVPGEERQAPFVMPDHCRSAGRPSRAKAPILLHRQTVCVAQLKGAIEHFASEERAEYRRPGGKTVAQLVDAEW